MRGRGVFAALLAAGAVSVLLRWPFLSVPLNSDEGGYAYTAHWMLQGLQLYRDLWFDRPQGTFLIYAGIFRLFGESVESIRFGAAVYNALTVVLLALLGRRLLGTRAGLAAAGLFAVASASPQVEGFTANGELLMNLPVAVTVLLAARRRWFLAGIVSALAFAVKPTALLSAVPPVMVLCIMDGAAGIPRSDALRRTARRLGNAAAGGVLGLVPFAAHGLLTDPAGYWYAVVGFRVEAHSAFSVGVALVRDFAASAPSVLLALLPVWALAGGALVLARRRDATWWADGHGRGVVVGAALLGGGLLGAAAGGYWYWHYYVGLLPGACLLAGAALVRLAEHVQMAPASALPRVATGGLMLATVAAVAFNARLVGETPQETSWRLYQRPSYLASRAIAEYVRSHTTASDRVYAAFAEAELYYLAQRRSAGRQLYWTEINRVPGAFDRVLATLDDPARRPTYVVAIDDDLETTGRAAAFWERVRRYYRQEISIRGFRLFHVQMPFLHQDALPDADDARLAGDSTGDTAPGGEEVTSTAPDEGTDV